jgi:hypothetical protein
MGSFPKGRECAQSGITILLTGWLREVCVKHDKFYQSGRACIEIVRGSVKLFIALVVCRFLDNSWVLQFSPSRWPFFKFFFGFGSFNCASFDLESEIQPLCNWSCQSTHQRGDWETKWFVPWFICVMSNWLDLVWIWIRCISVELTPNWLIRLGEMCLFVSWCVGDECDMVGSDEDRGRSRRLDADD